MTNERWYLLVTIDDNKGGEQDVHLAFNNLEEAREFAKTWTVTREGFSILFEKRNKE
jgi:hypothetical protein